MVVVEGATLATFVTGTITMIIIGILLNIVGLGIFCWALFALATHALPFFVGMTVGIYSFQAGAGPFGAIVVGFVMGGFTLVRRAVRLLRRALSVVRLVIGLLFAVPAARAGYDVTLALAHVGIPPEWWREVVRRAWRRHRRGHRLGACVDADRPRSGPGAAPRPSPATDWGDDHGQVTHAVRRLSVGMSADIRSSLHDRDVAVLSHFD